MLLGGRENVPEGGQDPVGPGDSFTNLVAGAGVRREGPSDPAHREFHTVSCTRRHFELPSDASFTVQRRWAVLLVASQLGTAVELKQPSRLASHASHHPAPLLSPGWSLSSAPCTGSCLATSMSSRCPCAASASTWRRAWASFAIPTLSSSSTAGGSQHLGLCSHQAFSIENWSCSL